MQAGIDDGLHKAKKKKHEELPDADKFLEDIKNKEIPGKIEELSRGHKTAKGIRDDGSHDHIQNPYPPRSAASRNFKMLLTRGHVLGEQIGEPNAIIKLMYKETNETKVEFWQICTESGYKLLSKLAEAMSKETFDIWRSHKAPDRKKIRSLHRTYFKAGFNRWPESNLPVLNPDKSSKEYFHAVLDKWEADTKYHNKVISKTKWDEYEARFNEATKAEEECRREEEHRDGKRARL